MNKFSEPLPSLQPTDLPVLTDSGPVLSFEASDPDGANDVLGARIPLSWFSAIQSLREAPGTPFPKVWRHNSDFARFAIAHGIKLAQALMYEYQSGEVDGFVEAQAFLDRSVARVKARAQLLQRTKADMDIISEGIDILVGQGEYAEAADMLISYLNDARKLGDSFWKGFFTRSLLSNSALKDHVRFLNEHGYAIDPLISQEISIDPDPEEAE